MRHLFIICIVVFLLGCNNSDKPSKPDGLISKEKMSDILYDVFLLNAAKGINKKVLEINGVSPQDYVYKKHNIDSLQFALSNNYYAYDAKTYEVIMAKVKDRIEAERIIVDALIEKEKKVRDSLDRKVKDSLSKVKKNLLITDTLIKKIRAIPKEFN